MWPTWNRSLIIKNIDMMFVTKPHNVATNNRPASWISWTPTETCLTSRLFSTVAVGRSVCEHFRHIQVSPTCKRKATVDSQHVRTDPFKVFSIFNLEMLPIHKFFTFEGGWISLEYQALVERQWWGNTVNSKKDVSQCHIVQQSLK